MTPANATAERPVVALNTKRVLIVEDEVVQQRLLQSVIDRAGFASEVLQSGDAALERLADKDLPSVDVMILDQVMPGKSGLDVLLDMRARGDSMPVIMLTGQASISTVVEAMRAGATDFIVKPASAERLRTAVQAALDGASLSGDVVDDLAALQSSPVPGAKHTHKIAGDPSGFQGLVGSSPSMERLKKLGEKAAQTSIPVLIEGESGVGKEVFARAIHQESERRSGRFVAVNCGAIPDNLVESILFGHEKGAFTGATEHRTGMFKEADGGTLFLDEVGELPPDVQVKLLRALQEREIHPVGGKSAIKVDIRIISATNRTLVQEVEKGHFREDLFYRLNVFPVVIPPLRDRLADIGPLADHLLSRLAMGEGMAAKTLSSVARSALESYHWPGNIRQLQNALFRASVLSDSTVLEAEDFPVLQTAPSPIGMPPQDTATGYPSAIARPIDLHGPGTLNAVGKDGHIRPMAALERDLIKTALKRYDGRMAEVARRLDIGRSTLYRKVALYGLDDDVTG